MDALRDSDRAEATVVDAEEETGTLKLDPIAAVLMEIGAWFVYHYETRVENVGVHAAAKQLRKQGVPCEIAGLILIGKATDKK